MGSFTGVKALFNHPPAAPAPRRLSIGVYGGASDCPALQRCRMMPGHIQFKPRPRWADALRLRLTGAGGLFNLGHACGLATSLALHLASGEGGTGRWWGCFFRAPAALVLSMANAVGKYGSLVALPVPHRGRPCRAAGVASRAWPSLLRAAKVG